MARHLYPHYRGWKYMRNVPKDVQEMVGRRAWIKTFPSGLSAKDAQLEADALAIEHSRLVQRLRGLSPADRATLQSRGLGAIQALAATAETSARFIEAVAINTTVSPIGYVDDDPEAPDRGAQALMLLEARDDAATRRADGATAQALLDKISGKKRRPGLNVLVDRWIAVSDSLSPRSTGKARTYLRRFIEHAGDLAPRAVTAEHARQFRDWLEKQDNISRASAEKHMHALSRLYVVALSEGLADTNPFRGVKVRKAAKASPEKRKAFEPGQIKTIFDALAGESDDFCLMVRLLTYHGMRSGEAAQLRVDDITVAMGVPVIRIHAKHGSIKNKGSERDVPIQPTMLAELQARVAQLKQGWLFPSFPTWRGNRGEAFQRNAGPGFLRAKCKITDKALTMHSLRHTWRTLARELNMPEAVSRSIMGHSLGKDDHAGYGGLPSLKQRAEWMARIDPLGA